MEKSQIYFLLFYLLASFIISVVAELMILPRIIYIAKKKRLFDLPDCRKKHCMPIPRLGGISFTPIIVLVVMLMLFVRYKFHMWSEALVTETLPELILFVCGLFVIYLLGAKDDLVGVDFKKKFVGQFVASLCIVGSGTYINNLYGLFGIYEIPAAIGIVLSILTIIFTINAINLIDGADGLASGLSAVALLLFGFQFCYYGLWTYASIAFSALGILIPFFYYNFFHPTRKIFMGDTGSLTLGYILIFMLITLAKNPVAQEVNYNGYLLLLFSALFVPLFDAFRVMFVRIMTKRPPFSPDRNHIHHKIIDLGISKRRTVFMIVISSIFIIALNWLLLNFINCNIVLVIDLVVGLLISVTLIRLTKKKVVLKEKEIAELES